MNCKRLSVKLIQKLNRAIIIAHSFCVKIYTKINDAKPNYTLNNAKFCKHKYWVSYCIQYRPVGVLERILARGWRNDAGIWTPDGKFND